MKSEQKKSIHHYNGKMRRLPRPPVTTEMIKLIMCLTRKSNLTREEFQDYWLKKHGPFFMENAKAMGTKRYVQSHTLNSGLNQAFKESRGMLEAYDGVAEVWLESEEALMEAMGTKEAQEFNAALLKDEGNFFEKNELH